MGIGIVTDSTTCLPAEMREGLDLGVASLFVNDGASTQAESEMDWAAFYARLRDLKTLPTTSQPSVESIVRVFRERLERGDDVVGVFLSSKMSGTMQAAELARSMVLGDFPERRIELVDSLDNTGPEGLAVYAAAMAARAGETIEAVAEAARRTIPRTRYLFAPESLEYLRRGGRIGGASALIGQILQIRPILTVRDGETDVFARVRTQSRALAEIARRFADDAGKLGLVHAFAVYIVDRAAGERFAREQLEPVVGHPVPVVEVGPVVGLHVGPAVGVVYQTVGELEL